MAVAVQWLLRLHRDVPRAARFYAYGLGMEVDVCTKGWAQLRSGPLKLALLRSSKIEVTKDCSSMLSFTVTDLERTLLKLVALGAELDGPIKYEIYGKMAAVRCMDDHLLGLYEPMKR